jgi:hypothetical protein
VPEFAVRLCDGLEMPRARLLRRMNDPDLRAAAAMILSTRLGRRGLSPSPLAGRTKDWNFCARALDAMAERLKEAPDKVLQQRAKGFKDSRLNVGCHIPSDQGDKKPE